MEPMRKKIERMNKALNALKENFQVEPESPLMERIIRNSKIKCFEFSFDFFWKTLKVYLSDVEKVVLDSGSPSLIIRECVQTGILSEQEGKLAMDMRDSRNLTSHTYRQDVAESIVQKIPDYYQFMYMVTNRLKID